jgi:hypothetical protein
LKKGSEQLQDEIRKKVYVEIMERQYIYHGDPSNGFSELRSHPPGVLF